MLNLTNTADIKHSIKTHFTSLKCCNIKFFALDEKYKAEIDLKFNFPIKLTCGIGQKIVKQRIETFFLIYGSPLFNYKINFI
jgi:hypothetical protein